IVGAFLPVCLAAFPNPKSFHTFTGHTLNKIQRIPLILVTNVPKLIGGSMTFIFELPIYLSFVAFAVLGILFYAVGRFALAMLSKHAASDILSIPIGAFIGTIATDWALSLGFVAADIWSVNSRADQAGSEERSAISRLIGTANADILAAPALST